MSRFALSATTSLFKTAGNTVAAAARYSGALEYASNGASNDAAASDTTASTTEGSTEGSKRSSDAKVAAIHIGGAFVTAAVDIHQSLRKAAHLLAQHTQDTAVDVSGQLYGEEVAHVTGEATGV